MEETITEKVQRFLDYIQEMVEVAVNPVNLKNQAVHSKVLLSAIFDSISKSAFPDIKNNNARRYKKLIDDYSEWNEANNVSLLHLFRLLEREENLSPDFKDINKWCIREFSSKFPTTNRLLKSHTDLTRDPDINKVIEMWPTHSDGKPIKLGNIANPEELTHKNLFWLYRNSLVHEYRNPGNGVERIENGGNKPFYHNLSTITSLNEGLQFTNNWELVYPFGFFRELCLVAAQNVSRMHANNDTSRF